MKNFKLVAFFTFLLLTSVSFSQSKGTSELAFSLGAATLEDFRISISDLTTSVFTSIIPGAQITYEGGSSSSGYTSHFGYAVKDNWMVGGTITCQSISRNLLVNKKQSGKDSSKAYTFAVETDYRYVSKPMIQMYSGLGIGFSSVKSNYTLDSSLKREGGNSDSFTYFSYHVTALGLRVGKKLAGIAEFGFGYKGIASLGISYQF